MRDRSKNELKRKLVTT